MSSAAQQYVSGKKTAEIEKIVNFSPAGLRAPFALRCAALCIDYLILIALPVAWLTLSRLGGAGNSAGLANWIWAIGIIIFLANFLILPLVRGQTIGKTLTGLTVLNFDGTDLSFSKILIRNTIGYLLTVLSGGLGFLIAAVNTSGRSLHDFIAGTIVIRGRKTQL